MSIKDVYELSILASWLLIAGLELLVSLRAHRALANTGTAIMKAGSIVGLTGALLFIGLTLAGAFDFYLLSNILGGAGQAIFLIGLFQVIMNVAPAAGSESPLSKR